MQRNIQDRWIVIEGTLSSVTLKELLDMSPESVVKAYRDEHPFILIQQQPKVDHKKG